MGGSGDFMAQSSDIKKEIKTEPVDIKPVIKTENMETEDIKPKIENIKTEIKKEPESSSTTPSAPATPQQRPPLGANKVKFTKEELKEALEPPLMKMHAQEPEAQAFRLPVDPQQLNIPDYFDIIKKPMDMSCIKQKLDTGAYKDPWEFVDDVWLMFENAWVYNRKTSRVYKWCSKV